MEDILKIYEIFLACGGKVSTDSRKVERGALFVALRGERFDGNMWAAAALAAGAGAAVVDERFAREQAARGSETGAAASVLDDRYIVVEDTLAALQQLAAHHRRELGNTILAITGTNGKTTTKELTAAVLAKKFRTRATEGNLNNHIGVPLTLLGLLRGEVGIVEMGASALGEIAALAAIAAPELGLITNVGRAHLEGFGGEAGVRQAKGELYDYLAASKGTALVRAGDPTLMAMAAERGGSLKIVAYPAVEGFASQLAGDYNAHNVAAAVAVGRHFGVPEHDIRAAIESYTPTNNRSQRVRTAHNTLTVDCYNANPSSMAAALGSFGGDTAILGDMAELGEYAFDEHLRVLRVAFKHGIGHLLLVGEHFAEAAQEVEAGQIELFADTGALVAALREHPLRDRDILIKGSRSVGLEKIVELL